MPPKKAIKLLPNQSKLNTFLNLNKHVSTVNDVNNNNDKNTNNNDQSQDEALSVWRKSKNRRAYALSTSSKSECD